MRTAIAALIVALAAGPVRAEAEGAPEAEREAAEQPAEVVAEPALDAHDDAPSEVVPTDAMPAADASEGECASMPVPVKRTGMRGSIWVQLADCKGVPFPAAAQALSALALPPRPRASGDAQHADAEHGEGEGDHEAEPGADPLPRINPELLVRLHRVAERYPGRAIEIVSGFRTRGRGGSRHRSFDALDIRVEGVSNEELSELARTFEGTGVGYYPNSTFVHLDVRETAAYWVDKSGPGEPARYVPKSKLEAESMTVADVVAPVEPGAVVAPDPVVKAVEAAEPVVEPAAEPVVAAEAAVAEPVVAEPVTAEPVVAEPVVAEPVVAEPAAAEPAAAAPVPDAPQLASIAERALAVMNRALGRSKVHDSTLPGRQRF